MYLGTGLQPICFSLQIIYFVIVNRVQCNQFVKKSILRMGKSCFQRFSHFSKQSTFRIYYKYITLPQNSYPHKSCLYLLLIPLCGTCGIRSGRIIYLLSLILVVKRSGEISYSFIIYLKFKKIANRNNSAMVDNKHRERIIFSKQIGNSFY